MQKLSLQQKLLQKLSPQQIQFIKLLQIPTSALEARIKEELEENPALEDGEQEPDDEQDDAISGLSDSEQKDSEISLEEYMEEAGDFEVKTFSSDDMSEEKYERPTIQLSSLYDNLLDQAGFLELDETEVKIAEQILGSIDEDGYIRRSIETITDELIFKFSLSVTDEQVEKVLKEIQKLEPSGVGARDLRECLLIQLHRKKQTQEVKWAIELLDKFFEDFTKKHFEKIREKLHITEAQFKDVYNLIKTLNPKPGESQSEVKHQYIIPDFIVHIENEEIEVKLNRKNAPELRVNKRYVRMLQEASKSKKKEDAETIKFVKEKLDAAKWFIDAVKQRQYTLLNTMIIITEKQKAFFLHEDDEAKLKPMILKNVADELKMDISTVSRIANSKFVQTEFGIYPLKFFFSEGVKQEDGEEVSNREIKSLIKTLIENESKSKPLSDEQIAALLEEQNYHIARRTVAKYREQLNIPVARLRKDV